MGEHTIRELNDFYLLELYPRYLCISPDGKIERDEFIKIKDKTISL